MNRKLKDLAKDLAKDYEKFYAEQMFGNLMNTTKVTSGTAGSTGGSGTALLDTRFDVGELWSVAQDFLSCRASNMVPRGIVLEITKANSSTLTRVHVQDTVTKVDYLVYKGDLDVFCKHLAGMSTAILRQAGTTTGQSPYVQGLKEHVAQSMIDQAIEFNRLTPVNSCEHKWKQYHGLNESFEYCEVCDAKK